MNHTCLCLPSRSWYSFTDPGGMEGWVGLGAMALCILIDGATLVVLGLNEGYHHSWPLLENSSLKSLPKEGRNNSSCKWSICFLGILTMCLFFLSFHSMATFSSSHMHLSIVSNIFTEVFTAVFKILAGIHWDLLLCRCSVAWEL